MVSSFPIAQDPQEDEHGGVDSLDSGFSGSC